MLFHHHRNQRIERPLKEAQLICDILLSALLGGGSSLLYMYDGYYQAIRSDFTCGSQKHDIFFFIQGLDTFKAAECIFISDNESVVLCYYLKPRETEILESSPSFTSTSKSLLCFISGWGTS